MKTLAYLLLILLSPIVFAHENIIITKVYDNIEVRTYSDLYYEEINKTLIIGQYAKILSEKMEFNFKINLIFLHNYTNEKKDKYFVQLNKSNNKIDSITIVSSCLSNNIKDVLQILENSVNSQKKILREEEVNKILSQESSEIIKRVLKEKIYRPEDIQELRSDSKVYTYYFQLGKYHIVRKINELETEITTLNDIFQFVPLNNENLIVFSNQSSFYYIKGTNHSPFKIHKIKEYHYPYRVELLGTNKILIKFINKSDSGNRVLILYSDKNIFIQDLDEFLIGD